MAFTEETAEFLVVNRLTDSKLWFHEHKEDYLRLVKNPLTALCEALAPCIAEIDPMRVDMRIHPLLRERKLKSRKVEKLNSCNRTKDFLHFATFFPTP